jgi:RNA polymerase sigma-70 factor (ECF subfamily)
MSLQPFACAPVRSASVLIDESESLHVRRLLRSRGLTGPNLDDAHQEVFVVALARLDTFDSSRPLRRWLFGIALRIACEMRRKAQRSIPTPEVDDAVAVDNELNPEERMSTEEDCAIVRHAVERLDLDQREVLILHDIDGLSAPQIAARVSAPLNTVYSRLRLARAKVTRLVQRGCSETRHNGLDARAALR